MFQRMVQQSLFFFFFLSLVTGFIYPVFLGGFGHLFWKERARGSQIILNETLVGSELLGQKFTRPEFFWGRPSSSDYSALPSSASQLSPISRKWSELLMSRRIFLGCSEEACPADLLTSSGSGLDPHISREAAFFQVSRVSKATGISATDLRGLIEQALESKQWGFLGAERVNVLRLNLEVKKLLARSN